MRLACLCADPGIPYGGTKGASVHLHELTAALAAEGADVLVLAAAVAPGATAPRGVTVEALPVAGKGADAATRLATDAARAAWLEGRLAAHRSDALHEQLALHTTAGATAAAALRIPYLVEVDAPLTWEAAELAGHEA